MICQEVYIKMEFINKLRENIQYFKYIIENYCNIQDLLKQKLILFVKNKIFTYDRIFIIKYLDKFDVNRNCRVKRNF